VRPFTEGSDIITDLNAPLLNLFLLIAHDTVVGSQYHARTFKFFFLHLDDPHERVCAVFSVLHYVENKANFRLWIGNLKPSSVHLYIRSWGTVIVH
jgi:hypothetical protein